MRDRGFLPASPKVNAIDLVKDHMHLPLLTISENDTCEEAFARMQKFDVSQIPVINGAKEFVGSLSDNQLYAQLLKNREMMQAEVRTIMQSPFPIVKSETPIDEVSTLIHKENSAVLVMDLGGNWHIITKYDIISAL